VMQQTKDLLKAAGNLFLAPVVDTLNGTETNFSGLDSLGAVSLVFGLVYLGVAAFLDRRELTGIATPAVLAALLALITSIPLFGHSFGTKGIGIYTIVLGLLVCAFGATSARRFSTWLGGLAVLEGFGALIIDSVHSANSRGTTLIVVGAALIALAAVLTNAWHEPDETIAAPSRFGLAVGSSTYGRTESYDPTGSYGRTDEPVPPAPYVAGPDPRTSPYPYYEQPPGPVPDESAYRRPDEPPPPGNDDPGTPPGG
jgi:uncharacterized membrane protein